MDNKTRDYFDSHDTNFIQLEGVLSSWPIRDIGSKYPDEYRFRIKNLTHNIVMGVIVGFLYENVDDKEFRDRLHTADSIKVYGSLKKAKPPQKGYPPRYFDEGELYIKCHEIMFTQNVILL